MQAKVPANSRVYAVGDIHGRVDLLRTLNSRIVADAEGIGDDRENIVIYLGDYVDRGDQSREVISTLIDDPLAGFSRIHLSGNHERYLLQFLKDPEVGPSWLFNGGDATLRSYGVDLEDPAFGREGWPWAQQRLIDGLPAPHLAFLRDLILQHVEGDYMFVHAGVRPGVALDRQDETDLLWIRDDFLRSTEQFGKMIVHGHTVTADVEVHLNRIGIDTGAYISDTLSCLVLEGGSKRFIQT